MKDLCLDIDFFSSKISENKVWLPDGKDWWVLRLESLIPHEEVI